MLNVNRAYCGTRLLSDPLTSQRARQLAAVLDHLSLPLLAALMPLDEAPLMLHPGGLTSRPARLLGRLRHSLHPDCARPRPSFPCRLAPDFWQARRRRRSATPP